MKAEDVQGTTKKLFRLKHCFDYYKDLPVITETTKDMAGRTVPDYLKVDSNGNFKYFDSIKYWVVTKDMYWKGVSDEGSFTWGTNWHTGGNNGISSWKRSAVYNTDSRWYQYWPSDDHSYGDYYYYSALVYPSFVKGNSTHFSRINGTSYTYKVLEDVFDHYDYYIWQSGSNGSGGGVGGWFKTDSSTYSSYSGQKKTESVYKQEYVTHSGFAKKQGSSSLNNPGICPIVIETEYCDDFDYYKFNNAFSKGSKSNVSYTNGWGKPSWVPSNGTASKNYYYRADRTGTLKYPYASDTYFKIGGYSLYVDYVDCTPYVITKEDLKNNPNYYFPKLKIGGYQKDEKTGWDNSGRECRGSVSDNHYIWPTLMHEYITPTIELAHTTYLKDKFIGKIRIKYSLLLNNQTNTYEEKNIPIYFSAYKCEAYTNK